MNISVRDVNAEAFKKFKMHAIKHGLNIGSALNEALNFWVDAKEQKKRKLRFLELKPIDFGKNSENSSIEIDKMIYSERK